MICDFCSDPHVRWDYPAPDFLVTSPVGDLAGSAGGWSACGPCHDLIEAGDREGLLQRAVTSLVRLYPNREPRAQLRRQVRTIHLQFFEWRTGAPVPVTTG